MSKQPIARYSTSYGLDGCYMPDSHGGCFEATTRKELADMIRHEIEFHEMPKSMFGAVRITRLWAFIKRNGSSVAHFSLTHKGYCLSFHGMTEEEFDAYEAE